MIDIPRFLAELLTWQGVPWHHQGRTRAGVDCVGLALAALAEQGIRPDVPADYHPSAVAALLLANVEASPLLERRPDGDTQPGDVLVFRIYRQAQHLAVALGDGRMIHAVRPHGVAAVTMSAMWQARLVACFGWAAGG